MLNRVSPKRNNKKKPLPTGKKAAKIAGAFYIALPNVCTCMVLVALLDVSVGINDRKMREPRNFRAAEQVQLITDQKKVKD